jgi:hypothetical protein
MKVFILFLLLFSSMASAQDCHDLMRTFFRKKAAKVINEETSNIDIAKYGFVDNSSGRKNFNRLYLQCQSTNKSLVTDPLRQRFSSLQHKLSLATTVVGYSAANWQKPKDMQWFGKMVFGVAFGEVVGKLAGKLIKDNGNRFHYLIKDYIFTRSAVAMYLTSSPYIFDNDKSYRQKMSALKTSDNFQEEMRQLKSYATSERLIKRYQKEVMGYLSHLEVINLGFGVQQGVDFDKLTPEDLDDEDIQKVVMAAIIAQEYENQKGFLNVTQNNSADFFLFDALYSIAKIPKDMAVTKIVNQVLCLNAKNPSRGLTQAVGISALNQIMFADFYGITYRVAKKEFINQ